MNSISSITPASNPYQATNLNAFVQFVNDFNAIGNALQSGDLAGAQGALADFQQDLPSGSQSAKEQPFGSNEQANADYANLVGSLQGGDMQGAQAAYANLQNDLESGGKTRRRYYNSVGSANDTQTETASDTSEADLLLDAIA